MKLEKWLVFATLFLAVVGDAYQSYAADRDEVTDIHIDLPVSDKTAAGVLIYSRNPFDHKLYVLLGERRSEWCWGNFGGKSEVGRDRTLVETAIREVYEESAELIRFSAEDLLSKPFHDLRLPTGETYRMFIAASSFVDAQVIKEAAVPGTLAYQEYQKFRWIVLDDLLRALKESEMTTVKGQKTFKVGTLKIHPPLAQMLLNPRVQQDLMNLTKM